MAFTYLRHTALIALLLHIVVAQQSNIVPEDLRSGFRSKGKEVQVSYTNEAVNGFKDGTAFDKDAVSQEPTFALGDSSGITPTTLYTIIMVDTTCPNKRVLHYARSNFKNNFDITNIATESAPLLEYKAPGAFGETGDNRQYIFLMYTNPQRRQIDQLQMPAEGEAFDATKFKTDNGLNDPEAGVGMVVSLGGTADCGGDQPNGVPDNLPSARPPRSSGTNARPTSTAAEQETSSAANGSPTVSPPSNNGGGNATVPSGGQTSGLAVASSVLQTGGRPTSTVALGSGAPGDDAEVSQTQSSGPVQQTVNAAPGTFGGDLGLLAPLMAVAGWALW